MSTPPARRVDTPTPDLASRISGSAYVLDARDGLGMGNPARIGTRRNILKAFWSAAQPHTALANFAWRSTGIGLAFLLRSP